MKTCIFETTFKKHSGCSPVLCQGTQEPSCSIDSTRSFRHARRTFFCQARGTRFSKRIMTEVGTWGYGFIQCPHCGSIFTRCSASNLNKRDSGPAVQDELKTTPCRCRNRNDGLVAFFKRLFYLLPLLDTRQAQDFTRTILKNCLLLIPLSILFLILWLHML